MPIGTSNASTTRRQPRPRPDPGDGGGGDPCATSYRDWCASQGGAFMTDNSNWPESITTCYDNAGNVLADPCPNRDEQPPPPGGDGDGDGKDAPDDVEDPNDARCGPNATWDFATQTCVPTPTTRDPYDRSPGPGASNLDDPNRIHGNPSRPTIPPVTGAPTTQGTTAEQQIPWWSFTEGGPQQPGVEQQPQAGGGQATFGGQNWAQQAQQALMNSPQMWRWS